MMESLMPGLIVVLSALIMCLAVAGVAGVGLVLLERKVLGDLQIRYGPMRVGWHGLLQTLADTIKMIGKEDTVPTGADKRLFWLAPIVVFIPAVLVYLVVPLDNKLVFLDWDISLFWIFAISSITPVGIIIAGWASYNKWSLLGGLRSAAQQISYEVPLLLSVLGVIMLSSSMNLGDIVDAQMVPLLGPIPSWFIILQPLGFILFMIAAMAELNRTPFDIPEAESELVAGYNTEYSGMKFGLFMLSEYANIILIAFIGALIFLGGWHGPDFSIFKYVPDPFWLLIKVFCIVYFVIWVRGTWPRVRIDQLMDLGWKLLLPLALANLLLTGLVLLIVRGMTG